MREHKALKDELVSFQYWLKNYGMASKLIIQHPIKFYHTLMRYPWLFDDLKIGNFIKNQTDGYKGYHHKVQQELYHSTAACIFQIIRNMMEGGEKLIIADEMIPRDIFNAMGLTVACPEINGFTVAMCDQNAIIRYFDFMENKGVPTDVCSLPMSQAGVVLNKEMPETAQAYVMTNVPCDAHNVVSQFFERQYKDVPRHMVDVPDFADEHGWADPMAEKSLWAMIEFLEKTTGHKMDWKKLKKNCERYNYITKVDLEKWDYAKTDRPVISGCTLWLPRLLHYTVGPGELASYKSAKKVSKWMKKAYQSKELAHPNIRFRAIVWNCPPQIYTMFMGWLEKCWGVTILCDLESYVSVEQIDTTSNETMIRDIAKKYCMSTMFKHTHGGIHRNLGDMIQVADEFKADFIINANQVACRGQAGYGGLIQEEARKHGYKLCWFDQDLMDKRIFSRQDMRDRMNDFMFNVMKVEPLDSSLLEIDDHNEW